MVSFLKSFNETLELFVSTSYFNEFFVSSIISGVLQILFALNKDTFSSPDEGIDTQYVIYFLGILFFTGYAIFNILMFVIVYL